MNSPAHRDQAQVRTLHFDLLTRGSDDAIPVVVSTDAVVEMPDGPEVLVHTVDAVDLHRAPLPIIVTHKGGQINVGIVDGLHVVKGQLRGLARFGSRPEAVGYRDDVLAGIIRAVSAGYARIKGHVTAAGVLMTTRWMPTHVAMVAEPADAGAGFYRDGSHQPLPAFELQAESAPEAFPVPTPAASAAAPQLKESMMDQTTTAATQADPSASTHQRAATAPAQAAAHQAPATSAVEMEQARRRGIENLCRANKIDDNIRNIWITGGTSIEAVSDELLRIVEDRGRNTQQVDSSARLGLSAGETRQYSLMNAIRAVADKNWSRAGFELECSQAIAKNLNIVTDPNRFFVPFEVQGREMASAHGRSFITPAMRRSMGNVGARDLTAASASGGGHLVGTQNMSFIEVLRNRSVAYRMGARRMAGLQGNVTVPRQTAAATAYWLSTEATAATESQQTFGQMALSPKTVGAYTEISRQLMLQSSPDAESIVTADLGAVAGLAIDIGVLRGAGTGGEPLGIVNTPGIGAVTGTTLGYGGILEFQTDIATANVMPEAGGYVTTPAVAAQMMQRVKFSGTASPLWNGNIWDGEMAGFAAMSSNQMAAATMLYGDWGQVVVGEWGVLQVEVNPYANFAAGIIGVRALVTVDVGLRYAAAFSLAGTIT